MRYFYLFTIVFLLCGCSNRISPYFISNTYLPNNNQVINDKLQFSHSSYGDVNFFKTKHEVTKHLKTNKLPFENVLVYGKTYIEPYYEYCILENSNKKYKGNRYIQKDTIIDGHPFLFIGIVTHNYPPQKDIDELSRDITFGKEYNKNLGSIFDIIDANRFSNQFLKGYSEFENYPVYSEKDKSQKPQLQLTYASFLGNNKHYKELINQWGSNKTNDSLVKIIQEKGISDYENVKREILSKTKEEKVIMFNENHFFPNHRILITRLLPELKAQGFNYLALETLDQKKDSVLNSGEKPDMNTGFYTREQHFAELLRTAQSLGFQFVAYENFDTAKERETAQADNLYNETFKKDSQAKVIVLAGISHITEKPDRNDKKWMAQHFKEKFNINPLTFSQTDLNNYRKVTQSVVLLASHHLNEKYQTTDFKLINNLSFQETSGNFSYKNEFLEKIQLTLYFEDELSSKNDFTKKIPYRSYLLHEKETFYTNLPNAKKIRLMVFDATGKALENRIVK